MANSDSKDKLVTIRVDRDLLKKVKIKSAEEGKPVATFLRAALEEWTRKDNKKREER